MDQGSALTTIAICQIITTVMIFLGIGGLIFAIFAFKNMISKKLDELMNRVQPVVDRAESIAQSAKETAEKVSEKVDHIMTKAESTADSVTTKVQSVSNRVEEAVNPQVVAAAGVVGTAVKCMQLYRDIMQIRQNTRQTSSPCEPEKPSI